MLKNYELNSALLAVQLTFLICANNNGKPVDANQYD